MASQDFLNGQAAGRNGAPRDANPHICGVTPLGNPRLADAEAGGDWYDGWQSAQPARVASEAEVEAARRVDISQAPARRRRRPGR